MRILLTTPTYPPSNSGLGNAVHRQAEALAGRGYEVIVATGGAQRSTRHDAGGVRVEQFAVTGAAFLRNPIRGDVAGYQHFLQAELYDVVVMHAWQTWSTDIPLADLPALKARKFVYSHCISTNMWLPYMPVRSLAFYLLWRPYWWALPKRMRQLDGVIFLADGGDNSRFDDLPVARRSGVPIHIIPNSLPEGTPGLDPVERNQVIAVGSYTRPKGFDFVLEAYANSSACNKVPVVLFGQEQTPYLETLREQATRLGIDPRMVTFRLGVADAPLLREYERARLFISGSYTECQPLVLLDAMATGTPFVARATGCISRMPGGRVVSSVIQAAREIDRLLSDPAAWRSLSVQGKSAAIEMHSLKRNTDRLVAVIEGRVGT